MVTGRQVHGPICRGADGQFCASRQSNVSTLEAQYGFTSSRYGGLTIFDVFSKFSRSLAAF